MPPITESYMTKNDYCMKMGEIIDTLDVSDFHIVTTLTH